MPLQRLSYVFIDAPARVAHLDALGLKSITPQISDYIEAHINALYGWDRIAGKTKFVDAPARKKFETLLNGSDEEFLAVTSQLSQQMAAAVDGKMKSGFLVTATRIFEGEKQSAILKLDHQDGAAATIKELEKGKYNIDIVQGLLDVPGKLQKGAAFPDSRSDSDVIVGEKYGSTHYFASVIGVQLALPERSSARTVAEAIARNLPIKKALVALRGVATHAKETDAKKLLAVAVADEKERGKILTELKKVPLSRYTPSDYPLSIAIKADAIQIVGSPDAISRQVSIEKSGDEWRITVTCQSNPTLVVKK